MLVGMYTVSCAFLLIYIFSLLISFGGTVVSGLIISFIILLQGLWGFVVFIVVEIINIKRFKAFSVFYIILINLAVLIYEERSKITSGISKIDESVIVRHVIAEGGVLNIGGVVTVILTSALLFGVYVFIEGKSNKEI